MEDPANTPPHRGAPAERPEEDHEEDHDPRPLLLVSAALVLTAS
jgi:hypothetical protein